jgi:hypothetical protein
MMYRLMIRSKPHNDMFKKHEYFMSRLRGLKNEWGISDIPELRDPGTLPMRQIKLSRYLRKGISGLISYQNRKYYEDEGQYDDYFTLEFNPAKHDYKLLVAECFPSYIEWFRGYRGQIADEEFIHLDFEHTRELDLRTSIYRVYPVSFFDDDLCRRALGLTMEEVARRLCGHVDDIKIASNGVLVVAQSTPINLEGAIAISDKLKALVAN